MSVNIDIGIDEGHRKKITEGLSKLLADSYTLYLKTHNYHWNVQGPMFQTLHVMYEEHYTELATAVDLIAERIRALGEKAPGSYKEFASLTSVEEEIGWPTAEEMIKNSVTAHETVIRTARGIFDVADDANDEATADLLTQRIQIHEKTAWMLRSLLAK
ncbi:MAG: Dps family protein [Bdellovibrionales bacterium]